MEQHRPLWRRLMTGTLGLALAAALTTPIRGADLFLDVPSDRWYAPYVTLTTQAGLMTGTGDASFSPMGKLTLGQTMVLVYQLHSKGTGSLPQTEEGSPWYTPYYQYCTDHGIVLDGVTLAQMEDYTARSEMVALLDQALPASQFSPLNQVSDGFIPDVAESDPNGPAIYKWYRAGVLSGDQNHFFYGSSDITRAEVSVILCQLSNLVERAVFDPLPQSRPVTGLTLTLVQTNLLVGNTTTAKISFTPADATDKTLTWSSSNPSVASVSTSGTVTAHKVGTATITATAANGVKTSAAVTVTEKEKPLTALTLTLGQDSLTVGGTTTAKISFTPADATDKTLTWSSSNPSVASVSTSGTVTAHKVGTATITATAANGVKASATVTVTEKEKPLTALTLTLGQDSLTVGGTTTAQASFVPADATDKTLTWSSSDLSVASVSTNGTVTAHKAGRATITATAANGVKASAVITVTASDQENKPLTALELEIFSDSLPEGYSTSARLTFLPFDATDKTVTWSSSDPTVATVDPDGRINALKAGTTTITVTAANGITASHPFQVTADPKELSALELTLPDTMVAGQSVYGQVTFFPSSAGDQSLTWSTDDHSVLQVDRFGIVTALKEGVASVTITAANGVSATHTISVEAKIVDVSRLTIRVPEFSVKVGSTFQAEVELYPANATDPSVTWSSSDTSILQVDQDDTVTACGVGTADLIATAANGVSDDVSVTVTSYSLDDPYEMVEEVLRLLNLEREKVGADPLRSDSTLTDAAMYRAEELDTLFSHTRPDGTPYYTVLDEFSIDSYSTSGENAAKGQRTPEEVIQSWMDSPGHRDNMLNSGYDTVGIGYYAPSHCWIQLFLG